MFSEVPFHCPPKELNEVEFTMKLREEDGQVTGFLNYFLNKRLLLLKVGLKLKYVFAATCLRVSVTLLALLLRHGRDVHPTWVMSTSV
jgi:hypothetical protein